MRRLCLVIVPKVIRLSPEETRREVTRIIGEQLRLHGEMTELDERLEAIRQGCEHPNVEKQGNVSFCHNCLDFVIPDKLHKRA